MLSRPYFENGCDACIAKAVRTSPNLAWDPHVSTKNDITCTFRSPECWSNCCHIQMSRLCHVYVTLVLQLCAILTILERAKQHFMKKPRNTLARISAQTFVCSIEFSGRKLLKKHILAHNLKLQLDYSPSTFGPCACGAVSEVLF